MFSLLILVRGSASGTIGPNVVVNTPGYFVANNSPSIVRNPRRFDNLVVVHRVDQPPYSASLEWSNDSGRSWRTVALPLPPGSAEPYAPDAAFAPDGTLYVSYVSLHGTGHVPDNLWVARSVDGGRTLSEPVRVSGSLAFQARLVAGGDGMVHVTWLQASEVGLFSIVGSSNPIVSSASSDHGRSFSAPVRVSDPERQLVGAATPIIDSKGRLVVLYEDFKRDHRDFENLDGPVWDQPMALVVSRSSDGGQSFSTGKEVDSDVIASQRFVVYLPEFPSLAAGPQGSLYVAWADSRNGDEDVLLRRSDNGGESWTAATRVNDNRIHDGTARSLPRVGVAANGRVDVLFVDGRGDAARTRANVYLASSGDRGKSFRNVRMTSSSFDRGVGPETPRGPVNFGSCLGLTSESGRVLAAWTDTRLGDRVSRRQDVVFAAFSREGSRRATVLWSLAAGVAAAMALL
ncbi:MAG: glycoside hydrolase, partial [Actinomycetota bacterium]|nr:glycoside hydrolase [Actinomycetota bacterium]